MCWKKARKNDYIAEYKSDHRAYVYAYDALGRVTSISTSGRPARRGGKEWEGTAEPAAEVLDLLDPGVAGHVQPFENWREVRGCRWLQVLQR